MLILISVSTQIKYADVAELVDALDLGSSGFIRECSSHFIRTSAPHSGERFFCRSEPARECIFQNILLWKAEGFSTWFSTTRWKTSVKAGGQEKENAMPDKGSYSEKAAVSQHDFPQRCGKPC